MQVEQSTHSESAPGVSGPSHTCMPSVSHFAFDHLICFQVLSFGHRLGRKEFLVPGSRKPIPEFPTACDTTWRDFRNEPEVSVSCDRRHRKLEALMRSRIQEHMQSYIMGRRAVVCKASNPIRFGPSHRPSSLRDPETSPSLEPASLLRDAAPWPFVKCLPQNGRVILLPSRK